jgi:hypothetical protein
MERKTLVLSNLDPGLGDGLGKGATNVAPTSAQSLSKGPPHLAAAQRRDVSRELC